MTDWLSPGLLSSGLITKSPIASVLLIVGQLAHMPACIFEKLCLLIPVSPILVEPTHVFLIHVVVMVGVLDVSSSPLLFHHLVPPIVQHPLLSYPLHPVIVLVGLLCLRYRMAVLVLSCSVLEVALLFHLSICTHR